MRTLVLNAGYEPLAVVPSRRAVVLIMRGKATMIRAGEGSLTGVSVSVPRPSVIVLARYVRRPRAKRLAVTRRGVLRRDGHRCAYCGRTATTVDHIQPRSRGGEDSWENLVACCLACNGAKGDKSLAQMRWTLPFRPREPRGDLWHLRGLEQPDDAWRDYLAAA
ncbi:HNH endonuclease [Falsarthrobacter nasiphocae]|uniref:5-methylcytosine-specific restriction endonuclease McrA n=1 Tax=Falsarthrobacter nasiphocae TaxID=189863 RepID=A0AAE3YGD6_9MICC|nr:HNH endonuclease [Falsarthrobacter nasiphocae]MDR6891732.1 5-methylcytosine-specific restriction endonuclease McrA [Falsarthrobacter nasiphocae]